MKPKGPCGYAACRPPVPVGCASGCSCFRPCCCFLRKRRDYDVVLVSGFRLLGISAMLAAIVTRKPTVLKADSSGEMSGEYFRTGLRSLGLSPEGRLTKFFLARRNALLRRADRFVCLSGEMRDEFIAPGSLQTGS
jgi:hypothetical protein